MGRKIKKEIWFVLFGVALGLFLGLFIFGTLIRVTLDLLFGWGDSGPMWVNVLILSITIITVYFTTKWCLGRE